MPLGVTVTSRTAPPSRGASIDTATLFAVGGVAAANATTAATEVRSITDVAAITGARAAANQALYDYFDTFFREGGQRGYIAGFHASATGGKATTYALALAQFTKDLGPGQVGVVGTAADATLIGAVFDHALANNRYGFIDALFDDTDGELTTLGGLVEADDLVDYGIAYGSWLTIPAPAGTIGGASRQVPLSAAVNGLITRVDALGNPNRAAAGRDFPFQYATGIVREVSDATRETLLNAGINTAANKFSVLQNYGFQSALAQNTDNPFWQANVGRARMWLRARAEVVGENYMFKPIDGQGRLAGALKTDLDLVCSELYEANGLYGDRPQDAYAVTVSSSVNTELTIAQGELNAVVEARFSLHAKEIAIELVSVPVTGRVSA
jgi:hypothetical protein